VAALPGRPDIVFPRAKVAVFIDGDFWHGYRFPLWQAQLSDFWQRKISGNRMRDARSFSALRRRGWVVIRIWQHEAKQDLHRVIQRVAECVSVRSVRPTDLKAARH
jgi:DNA mismatch endonuclease (patch repair protein)